MGNEGLDDAELEIMARMTQYGGPVTAMNLNGCDITRLPGLQKRGIIEREVLSYSVRYRLAGKNSG